MALQIKRLDLQNYDLKLAIADIGTFLLPVDWATRKVGTMTKIKDLIKKCPLKRKLGVPLMTGADHEIEIWLGREANDR